MRTGAEQGRSSIHADETSICTIRVPSEHWAKVEINHEECPKTRMDAGDFRGVCSRLHTFRITRLCMSCTRLKNKKLEEQEFR
jgi:hypothetical protein